MVLEEVGKAGEQKGGQLQFCYFQVFEGEKDACGIWVKEEKYGEESEKGNNEGIVLFYKVFIEFFSDNLGFLWGFINII